MHYLPEFHMFSGGQKPRETGLKMPPSSPEPTPSPRAALSPTALSLADAAALLTRAGGEPVTIEMLEADRAAGAPTNADGTLNLVNYAGWLVREIARGD
jgi:hypothetical protein